MTDLISISAVSLKYGSRVVLDNLSLKLRKGEIFVLLGPSGCGKTSLLRLISGVERPESGEILVASLPPRQFARNQGFGFVTHHHTLLPWRNVLKNVLLSIELFRDVDAADTEKALSLLSLAGLGSHVSHFPAQLSAGQKQRVAFLQALMAEARVLLLDEPLSALDDFTRRQLLADMIPILSKRMADGSLDACIWITHALEDAIVVGNKIGIFKNLDGGPSSLMLLANDPVVMGSTSTLAEQIFSASFRQRERQLYREYGDAIGRAE